MTGLLNPRNIVTAPNGDLFITESEPGRIVVIRTRRGANKPDTSADFATGLEQPFGLAFYPPGRNPRYLYVGNTGSVVRFPYHNGDLQARGRAEMVIPDIPSGGHLRGGGHWTRDLAFSRDGKHLFVSVGSLTNDWEGNRGNETHRADILEYTPEGKDFRIYASGIRNAVGIVVNPQTGDLWASVNERDGLGDNLVPDYITRVQPNGFYGWPWFYMGGHWDPRHQGEYPELRSRVLTPDVLLQSHYASLRMIFYTGKQFPKAYRMQGFAAEHGSWNRRIRTGYKVIMVPVVRGKPTAEFVDFMTGFVANDRQVWGRPVGVAVADDGSMMVTDDASGTVWRVSYVGPEARSGTVPKVR